MFKTFIENSIKNYKKHFRNHRNRNKLIGLDFSMKVAVCRAVLYPLHIDYITLGSVYSNMAAVTSRSRH